MSGNHEWRLRALRFWLTFTMPAATALGLAWGGAWIAALPVLIFVLVPIADALAGLDRSNPPEGEAGPWAADVALYAWLPVQVLMIGTFVVRAGVGAYTPAEVVGLSVSVGLTAGAGGINVAHELMHRSTKAERGVAELLMSSVCYPHFCIEHVHGHHRNVATPKDPASARRGESLFGFWLRTLWGSALSAWRIESRLAARGRRGFSDRRIRHLVLVLGFGGVAWWLGGNVGVAAFVGQALVAILLLETINYIEHYGLRRRELEPGRWERVRPQHSWNASNRITNWYLFNLQRHSDHHYVASRPYWALRHHEDVPQLPFGYPTAFLVALVPPLWRSVMDPRVDAWNARPSDASTGEVP